jgi:hypothetical protein
MKKMSVFDSGLKIVEVAGHFQFGSANDKWVSVPKDAVKYLFDLKMPAGGVIFNHQWVNPDTLQNRIPTTVEAYRGDNHIVVAVNGQSHLIEGDEMKDLRGVILGNYNYNFAFDPPTTSQGEATALVEEMIEAVIPS